MDSSHPPLKLLVLFLGLSYALSSAVSSLPISRRIKEEAMGVTRPFSASASATMDGAEFVDIGGGEGEGWIEVEGEEEEEGRRTEMEMKNDYPEPGPNPHHYPPPNPSKSTP
ncbi:hypothetical protein MLD38_015884 [Melastoma candidum]|uniref:Uncharacterized protein n=1 Tax=Melastoma candidum TaxID=119954 RepID=A0ACB9RH78_9MYRT|nr:hypothetical protein MLD38_015884 [Melastoma candidum]